MRLEDVCDEVYNFQGERPSIKAVWAAVQRMESSNKDGVPANNYKNCGRKQMLSPSQQESIVEFVKKWRTKRFCTCKYVVQALKLKASPRTIGNVLNRHGYFWRPLPKIRGLSSAEIAKRRDFVEQHWQKPASWWEENLNLVLDGVTLTLPPKPLSGRQRHMAQSIKHAWMHEREKHDTDMHTHNRYGVQLGTKVPLWGGFTGRGQFTLREWTPRPKMTKDEWARRVPALKRAIDAAGEPRRNVKAKVWHDNEKFLLQPDVYKKAGLTLMRFPPNSGDLNPIETVWAKLRRDLAKREQEDFASGKTLTLKQFRQRAGQLLQSYGTVPAGQKHSFLQKLIRGMPGRLTQCRQRNYGRCGK